MQLLLALVSCLLAVTTQGFVVPLPAGAIRTRSRTAMSSSPSPAEAVGLSTHPLAGRKIQFSDQEDSSERVTQVLLSPDGTLSMISDNTNAVAISGNWRPGVRARVRACLRTGNSHGMMLPLHCTICSHFVFVTYVSPGAEQSGLHLGAHLHGIGRLLLVLHDAHL